MNTTQYDSRTADKFVVRLPQGLRDKVDAAAVADDRSMNSIIVQAVKQYLDTQNRQELLLTALASAVLDDKVRDNQISETGESINTPVVSGARSLTASLVAAGDTGINEARQYLNSLASTARTTEDSSVVAQSMHIDERVKMTANAKRYEWLRDQGRITDLDSDLCVARDDIVYFGHDLDKNVDDAMRLARLEGLHPCAE